MLCDALPLWILPPAVLTVVSCSRQYEELPQTTLTLEPPFPEIFTGETVTLRCGVEGGSAGWKYLWYKDSEDTPVLQTAGRSITGDSYTITAAAVSEQGQYCCRGQKKSRPSSSQLSKPVTVTVSEGCPKAVLTLHPAWAPMFRGETVTLSCEVEGGSAGWRFKQYRDGREEAGCSDQYSRRDGDSCTIRNTWYYNSGVYWCESASGQKRSNAVNLTVSSLPKPALNLTPAGEILEGDTVTLSCSVQPYSISWRYLWYKGRQYSTPVYQTDSSSGTGAGYTISAAALNHSGEYWCRAGRGRNTFYSEHSDPIWVNVTALFSRVTLTASPGATVKEGEALNLTCEAAVNKTPRPELHYTIVRDGEPVTNSTDSALYSIASTEKSHTGSYTCAVESQGVKKSSQELHIEVQTSWQSAAAAAGFSVGFFVILLLIVFTLLLLYHKIRGVPCIPGGKRRERSDQNQDQAAGGVELSSRAQQPVSSEFEEVLYCNIDTSKHKKKKVLTVVSCSRQSEDNKELQSQADTELSVDRVSKSDEGSYKCTAWRLYSPYSGDSAEVLQRKSLFLLHDCRSAKPVVDSAKPIYLMCFLVPEAAEQPAFEAALSPLVKKAPIDGRPKPALSREGRRGEIFELDTVTLSCSVQPYSTGWRYLWYKGSQHSNPVYQTESSSGTGARYTISAAALNHSGEYWCRAGRGRNTFYSQYSDPIWVNVTALFSRVTLTASPGVTVKEGEALNLICEAAVNKTPRPELHYTIVRDREPVTNSTDSALYSIASTEKSHTGSYMCAVESQGVKKSSQELHRLQTRPK
ncbi:UNVERIFIED_CONTAM: hypothetical protein FKN15_034343 [Acipenser sinensis]